MLSKIKIPSWWMFSDPNDIIRELNGLVLENIVEYSPLDQDAVLLAQSDYPTNFFDHFKVEICSALMDDSDGIPNDHWLTAATNFEDIIELLSEVQTSGHYTIIGWNANKN